MTTLTSTQPPAGVAHRLQGRTRAATNFAIFAAVAVTIGWAGIALDRAMDEPRGNSLGMGLWLVLPALTAVLLFRLRPDGGGPLGLTLRFPQRTRWFTFAALFYLPFTALIVLAGIASGLGSFDASSPAGKPALLAGLVYALWHLPLYVYFLTREDFRATTSLPWALFIPVFFAGVLAFAVVFGELRLRTGSIWPGVLMHTIGGALVNPLILDGHLTHSDHGDALFSPAPNSLASIILLGLVGLLVLRRATAGS